MMICELLLVQNMVAHFLKGVGSPGAYNSRTPESAVAPNSFSGTIQHANFNLNGLGPAYLKDCLLYAAS